MQSDPSVLNPPSMERVIVQFSDGIEAVYVGLISLSSARNLTAGTPTRTNININGEPTMRQTLRSVTLPDGSRWELPR